MSVGDGPPLIEDVVGGSPDPVDETPALPSEDVPEDAPDDAGDDARDGSDPPADAAAADELEEIAALFPKVVAERDDYLDLARRVQADFENYKKRVEQQRVEQVARAAEQLVVELLPVLDACEAALAHGAADVAPIQAALFSTLERLGLAKVADIETDFDPNVHEAVLSEPSTDDTPGPVVSEVMRAGYSWNGRVVRPAMVKVRG